MVPALFVAHGIPSIVLESSRYTKFLRQLGMLLPKPTGIVILSAHWEDAIQQIAAAPQPETMYDFFGYPPQLYEMTYPASGDLVLSLEIESLFAAEGIRCELNHHRGLDHGAWSVLSLMYPAAAIPVVALSVNPRLVPEEQYRIGRALLPLRAKNIMIIGSGGTVHNLSKLQWNNDAADRWAIRFDQWLAEAVSVWDLEALFDYEQRAPYAADAAPTKEHLMPLFIAMGAGDKHRSGRLLHQQYDYGTMSLMTWMFK
ncbi:DODA-type extradiol aromatic ring-opening family dioxygenase [Paenibacillus sp. NPDC056579]|uniref:DODA-type extradiol aromatic ring-opening family dioxygenase n=1 Tax=Paenibacillus sp. NPDC056579 TaxID=3345871 RepID=UPI0036CE9755